jgi:hypothetical protein
VEKAPQTQLDKEAAEIGDGFANYCEIDIRISERPYGCETSKTCSDNHNFVSWL